MKCQCCGCSYDSGSDEYPLSNNHFCSSICSHLKTHDDKFCIVCEALERELQDHDFDTFTPVAAQIADRIHSFHKHSYPTQGKSCQPCSDLAMLLFSEFFFPPSPGPGAHPFWPEMPVLEDVVNLPHLEEFHEDCA